MNPRDILGIVFAVLLLYVVVRVFDSPARWAVRVMVNGAVGLAALWAWDMLFRTHGWTIGLNPVTGLTIGLLGSPGFLLLIAVKVLIL